MKPKKLKWMQRDGGYVAKCGIYGVVYRIWKYSRAPGWAWECLSGRRIGWIRRDGFKTLREAKAAAQAHFEEQVMRCLEWVMI